MFLRDGILDEAEKEALRDEFGTDVVTEDEHGRMQREIMATRARSQAAGANRDHWCSTGMAGMDQEKLFAVPKSSAEYRKVAELFLKTLPNATVDGVERIENGVLQELFVAQAGIMQKQLNMSARTTDRRAAATPPIILKELFHGTKAVESIVNSTDGNGFLPLLAGTETGAIWGHGTYFARDAKYSDSYARCLPSGKKQMLLVDVLVGRHTQGAKGMKTCPQVPGEGYNRFNSLVDNVERPSIYVVQHSHQAYPKYLITYY